MKQAVVSSTCYERTQTFVNYEKSTIRQRITLHQVVKLACGHEKRLNGGRPFKSANCNECDARIETAATKGKR